MAYLRCECGFVKDNIPDAHVGKKAKCPKCKNSVQINPTKIDESSPEQKLVPKTQHINKIEEDNQKWLKCPECGATFLPGSNHHMESPGVQEEKTQKAIPSTGRQINKKLIAVIGIGFLAIASILILFITGTNPLNFASSEPPDKLLNSSFLYDDLMDTSGAADDDITDVRNIYKLSNRELDRILDEYTVRDFVYIGLDKEEDVELEWEKVDDDSWKIIYHFRGHTGSMVFSGKGGNEKRYGYVTIDDMEFDRLPVSAEKYYNTINGRIITYFQKEKPTKSKPSSVPDFADFFVRFFTDEQTQLTHIQFPLLYTYIGEGEHEPEEKTAYIPKSEWDFFGLSWLSDGCCNILYFTMENAESNKSISSEKFYQFIQNPEDNLDNFFDKQSREHVIGIQGKEGGTLEYYHFKFIDGNWQLVKYQNLSM